MSVILSRTLMPKIEEVEPVPGGSAQFFCEFVGKRLGNEGKMGGSDFTGDRTRFPQGTEGDAVTGVTFSFPAADH